MTLCDHFSFNSATLRYIIFIAAPSVGSESDKNEIDRDLKAVFLSDTKESAIERFNRFKDKWSSKYQGTCCSIKEIVPHHMVSMA